jgi:hypothetical protein
MQQNEIQATEIRIYEIWANETLAIGGLELASSHRKTTIHGQCQLALNEVIYSIRLPEVPGETLCGGCGTPFLATGPTGHADDEPICDLCLLGASEALGMVLGLVAVVRSFAITEHQTRNHYSAALAEVGSFSRIYERVAARSGPPRLALRAHVLGKSSYPS